MLRKMSRRLGLDLQQRHSQSKPPMSTWVQETGHRFGPGKARFLHRNTDSSVVYLDTKRQKREFKGEIQQVQQTVSLQHGNSNMLQQEPNPHNYPKATTSARPQFSLLKIYIFENIIAYKRCAT